MKKFFVLLVIILYLGTSFVHGATTEVKFDFENFTVEDNAKEIEEITYEWEVFTASAASNLISIDESNGNKYLSFAGITEIRSWEILDKPYELSFDAQYVEGANIGFFVRGVFPVTKFNPKNGGGIDQVLYYLESDWYGENGGKNGVSSFGGSGIYLIPTENAIRLNIKNYQPDGLKIGTSFCDFDYPEGVNREEFFNVRFKDDGSKVEVFINGALLATVVFSEPGVYEEDEEDVNEYFKNAIVTNSAGTEVLRLANARINAEGCQLAISTRAAKVNIDNLTLSYDAPEPTDTPEPTDDPEDTPEPTPNVTSDKTDDATNAPAESKAPEEENDDGINTTVIAAIVLGVAVVGAVVVIVIALRSKKRK